MIENSTNQNTNQDLLNLIIAQKEEISRLKEENAELKNKLLVGNRMHYFLDVLDKGFMLIKENTIVDCNDNLVEMLGYYNKNEIIGKMPFELPIHTDFIEKLYINNRPFNKANYDNLAFKCKYNHQTNGEGILHIDIVSYNNLNQFTAYVFISVVKTNEAETNLTDLSLDSEYSFIQGYMATDKECSVEVLVEADTGCIAFANDYTYTCIDEKDSLIGKKIYNCKLGKELPILPVIFSNYESCKDKEFTVTRNTLECEIKHGLVSVSKVTINDSTYIQLIARDTTKYVNYVNNLRKNEEKYKAIFNNVNDAIYLIHADYSLGHKFIDVNDVACNRLGYTKEELLGMPISSIKAEDELYKMQERFKEIQTQDELFFESTHVSRYGDNIPVEISSRKINLFDDEIIISVARDITRRKWIENFLMQSEERNRRLVELLPNPVILIKDGCIVYANGSAKEFMAVEEKENITGRRLKGIFSGANEHSKNIFNTVLSGKFDTYQYEEIKLYRLKDDVYKDVELTTSLFKYSNKEVKVLHFRDLKFIKKSEKFERLFSDAVRYDTLKTLFFANLSHEFKTPLNVMLSAAQVLAGCVGEDDHNYSTVNNMTNKLRTNCFRLLRLVNNLIDLTKFDSGFYDMHSENCNIVSIVEDICQSVSDFVREKGLKLVFDTDNEEIFIACDPYKIERIMLNILSNAVKFTNVGGSIKVGITTFDEVVEISVEDNGIGIPQEMLDSIFKNFNQIDKSFTRKNEGCGIGLSLVKYLVQMHNGTIIVNSELDKGSEFIIRLPIVLISDGGFVNVDDRDIRFKDSIDIEFSDIY